jgi:hypothetical protein
MLTSEDYRQLAERCALLAGECTTPGVAEALKMLALDYLTRAAIPAGRQQQQTQRDRILLASHISSLGERPQGQEKAPGSGRWR